MSSGRLGTTPPPQLTPAHAAVMESLLAGGFEFVAFPLYATSIGIRRGPFAALLTPTDGGSFRMIGEPCYLLEGNLAVRIQREASVYFVWKGKEVLASREILAEFARFVVDLAQVLLPA